MKKFRTYRAQYVGNRRQLCAERASAIARAHSAKNAMSRRTDFAQDAITTIQSLGFLPMNKVLVRMAGQRYRCR